MTFERFDTAAAPDNPTSSIRLVAAARRLAALRDETAGILRLLPFATSPLLRDVDTSFEVALAEFDTAIGAAVRRGE